MTSRRTTVMLTLAGPMILLLAGGNAWAKDQVERPFKVTGEVTTVIDLVTGYWEMEERGVAWHIGAYTNRGDGNAATGSGEVTAANGDKVSWTSYEDPPTHAEITFTGGTGRFENASGGFSVDLVPEVVGGDGETWIIVMYSYTATGTITY